MPRMHSPAKYHPTHDITFHQSPDGHASIPPTERSRNRTQAARLPQRRPGMSRIAAAVLTPHVGDCCIGPLDFDFERGDQRVVGLDRDVFRFAILF